ncbi:hypothetical protein [Erythrobacter phage vB_EliS-L02]|nr:hypothetical protein [Erythrobacter phage vB_EliS-L02]
MDFQKMFDSLSDAMRRTRLPYHLSLGDLRDLAEQFDETVFIIAEDGGGITREHSYRGYYEDLAFERSDEPTPAREVLAMCERALSQTYEGYKGGDFTYGRDTPLWLAAYGTTGAAIVDVDPVEPGVLALVVKEVG